jgi:hypothetical protein
MHDAAGTPAAGAPDGEGTREPAAIDTNAQMAKLQETVAMMAKQLNDQQVEATRRQKARDATLRKEIQQMARMTQAAVARASAAEAHALSQGLVVSDQSAEGWIVTQNLEQDFAEPFLFRDLVTGEWENEYQSLMRVKFFAALKERLPEEMTKGIYEGDVLEIYTKILIFGREQAEAQIQAVTKRVHACNKGSMSMVTWLNKLYDLWNELSVLKQPMSTAQCRAHILSCLDSDAKYADAVKDIRRNPSWDMIKIKSVLTTAAHAAGDLLRKSSGKGGTQPDSDSKAARRKAKRAAKKAAKAAAADATKANNASDGSEKGNSTQRAFPQGGKGTTDARKETEEEKRKRLKSELCENHLKGKCKKGDKCLRRHVDLDELVRERKKNESEGGNAQTSEPSDNKAHARNDKSCFTWAENKTCSHGDQCRFSHDGDGGLARHNSRRAKMSKRVVVGDSRVYPRPDTSTVANKEQIEVGDLVTLTANVPIKELHNEVAQVSGISNTDPRRYQLQVSGHPPSEDSRAGQWLYNVLETGVPDTMICPIRRERAQRVLATRRGTPHRDDQQSYALNIMFDTGANVWVVNTTSVIKPGTLQSYDEPMATYGLGNQATYASQWGIVTFVLGGHEYEVRADYVPAETTTIVPGQWFDNGERGFSALLHDQALWIYDSSTGSTITDWTLLGKYPRHIERGNINKSSDSFNQDLVLENGKLTHVLYPMPDSFLVEYEGTKRVLKARASSASGPHPLTSLAPSTTQQGVSTASAQERDTAAADDYSHELNSKNAQAASLTLGEALQMEQGLAGIDLSQRPTLTWPTSSC